MLKIYPENCIAKLEFDKIKTLIHDQCISAMGATLVDEMPLITDESEIQRLLSETKEFKEILSNELKFPIDHFFDVSSEIKLLKIENTVLEAAKLHRLQLFLTNIKSIYNWLSDKKEDFPNLENLLEATHFEKKTLQEIQAILDEHGNVRSNASKLLVEIRKDIDNTQRLIHANFTRVLKNYQKEGYLSEEGESVRNDRLVLSILAEYKRKVKGIIHDESNTGKTVFIEPIEIIELSNDLITLKIAEARELARILKDLTDALRPYIIDFQFYLQLAGKLDFTRAKAILAQKLNAIIPKISSKKEINFSYAFHPLLKLKNEAQGKTVVPLNFQLNPKDRILLISGPNAGGKTLTLKTMGLHQLMLQSGNLVPQDEASVMRIFTQLFVELGDEQSIENELSTYSSRLRNMRFITEHADADTLILMDEMGTGTDPTLGGAIAESVLVELLKCKSFGVMNTHYNNLKLFASETPGFLNGAMLFDVKSLQPYYQLQIGKAGSSYTFEMAQTQGLQRHIIDRAKNKVSSQERKYDELLSQLQLEKKEWSQKQNSLQQKIDSYERKTKHLENEERRINEKRNKLHELEKKKVFDLLSQEEKKFQALYQEFLKELKTKESYLELFEKIKKEKSLYSQDIQRIQDNGTGQIAASLVPLALHDLVKMEDSDEIGEILAIKGNKATVLFGQLKTQVQLNQLNKIHHNPHSKKHIQHTPVVKNIIEKRSQFSPELDVRGLDMGECMHVLQTFIDTAILVMELRLRIIHGKGSGTLRNLIRQELKKVKSVNTFYSELDKQGGDGVTIVELKLKEN